MRPIIELNKAYLKVELYDLCISVFFLYLAYFLWNIEALEYKF